MKKISFMTLLSFLVGFSGIAISSTGIAASLRPLVFDCATEGTAAEVKMTFYQNPNYSSKIEFTEPKREELYFWTEMVQGLNYNKLLSGKEITLVAESKNSIANGGAFTNSGMVHFKPTAKSKAAYKQREVLLSVEGLVYLLNCQMK